MPLMAVERGIAGEKMQIRIGYDISFQTTVGLPMNFALFTHPSREADLVFPEYVHVQPERGPELPVQVARDAFGNKIGRIVSPGGRLRFISENIIRDNGLPDAVPGNYSQGYQAAPDQLPPDVLQYLMPSRYCEVELLQDRAWEMFGHIPPGYSRAKAVVDWVHNYVTFGYQYALHTKTAVHVWTERRGVCRDFQHLCITLHRALNLPARYVTGYLGDIGVPINPAPMDFSAWHEVYLGGRWWAMDGRHNQPRIGRVLMATGRDAVDVALTTQFGPGWLQSFKVITEEVNQGDQSSLVSDASNGYRMCTPFFVDDGCRSLLTSA
jgi:transglutaminase-like putative cysteine protease